MHNQQTPNEIVAKLEVCGRTHELTVSSLLLGVLASGASGVGKTASVLHPLLRQAIAFSSGDQHAKIGLLVLDSAREGTSALVCQWATESGRAADVVLVPIKSESLCSMEARDLEALVARVAADGKIVVLTIPNGHEKHRESAARLKAHLCKVLQSRAAYDSHRLVGITEDDLPVTPATAAEIRDIAWNLQTLRQRRGFVAFGTQWPADTCTNAGWYELVSNIGHRFVLS